MKATIRSIASAINQILDVPSLDPNDARRRKLLNIILLGLFALSLLGLCIVITLDVTGVFAQYGADTLLLYAADTATLVSIVVTYLINRYWKNWIASSFFLLSLTTTLLFSDTPNEIVQGRSLILFSLPIIMASVLLRPYAAFVAAILTSLLINALALVTNVVIEPFAPVVFLSIALISWLATRAMERAIQDLRTLNIELDQRVTERTQMLAERTEELAEALAKSQAILDSTADGIVVFGPEGKATIANPATEHLLGHPVQEIVGCNIEELMKDNVNPDNQEVIVDILTDRTSRYPSLKVKWDDKTLSMNAAPVKLDSGEEIGTVAVFRDFTQEAEMDRMRSTFLSIASHDLRSPLSAILGLTELVREGVFASPEQQRHVIDRVYANTQYMLSLASSLLGQAQIEAGILKLRLGSVSPSELVENVIGAMGILAQGRSIELTGHVGDDVPASITGDGEKLNQVLFNLVGNAIKFTQEGSVQVRAYVQDEAHWALEVSDTGRGIPEDAQDAIFEPFRQVESASATGVGLGLSIVKQLVDLMDGEIHLESAVGKGSTFTILLPIAPETPQ